MSTIRITTVDGTDLEISNLVRLEQEILRFENAALTLIGDLESGEAGRVKAALEIYGTLNERHSALTALLPEFQRRRAEEELIEEGRRIAAELRQRQKPT